MTEALGTEVPSPRNNKNSVLLGQLYDGWQENSLNKLALAGITPKNLDVLEQNNKLNPLL